MASLCDCSHDWWWWLLTLGERILHLCDPPCSAPSAGQEDSSLPSRFRDLFHEAVATSAPFFKATVYQTPVLDLPSPPPPSGTGNLIFWIIYLKLYSSRVMRDRKESWSHRSLFNFTSVRGNLFCSDLWHFRLTWSPRTTRIQTPALCDCHACSG